jgi:hypothetical protein
LGIEVAVGAVVYGTVLFVFFKARIDRYYRFVKELRREKA